MTIESVYYKIRIPRLKDVYPERGRWIEYPTKFQPYNTPYRERNTLKNYKEFMSRVKKIDYLKKQLRKAKINFSESIMFDAECRGHLIITNR